MQKLVYTNSNGSTVDIALPPYMLTSFDQGAPPAQFVKTKAPGQDGDTVEDCPLDGRTVQITFLIIGDSIEDLYIRRQNMFAIFNPKIEGNLLYTNDAGTRAIPCRPASVPAVKDRNALSIEMLVQLYCPFTYWREEVETVKYLSTWLKGLSFPSSFTAKREFGYKAQSLIINAVNPGDVPCGMKVTLKANATVVNPFLLNIYSSETIRVKKTLSAGDMIVINTEFGDESVTLIEGRTETNVFNWLDAPNAADFMLLAQGDNYLRYGAATGMENLEMSVSYTPKYTGA